MITFFNIHGAMIYVDEAASRPATRTCSPRSTMCRRHYARDGLGAGYVDQFVR